MGHPPSPVPYLERREIERKAAELTRPAAGGFLPSDAFDIAGRLDIPVIQADFGGSDVAGMLVREGARVEIQVRRDDPYERQNFTVAHELGHHNLRHPGTWEDTRNTMYRRSAWSADAGERRAEYQPFGRRQGKPYYGNARIAWRIRRLSAQLNGRTGIPSS